MKKTILSLLTFSLIFTGCSKSEAVYINTDTAIPTIIKTVDDLKPYIEWSCEYQNGYMIKGKDLNPAYDQNGNISFDEKILLSEVKQAVESFNTKADNYVFTTSLGEQTTINGGTYGSVVDVSAEYEAIYDSFVNKTALEDRAPIYKIQMQDISDSYVEISLNDQHVYVYINGVLSNETSCVTGTANTNRATPPGIYYISERINGKYLRGPGYVTWVNKWMRLTNSGIGLHDAVWRGKFGGNIYTYDGSHGCINLPMDFASWLFDNSFVGMPVFIY